jgi:hypothetical protein
MYEMFDALPHRDSQPHLGTAALRLVLQPSPELQQALESFIVPEMRAHTSTMLRSDTLKTLSYSGADRDGLRYSRSSLTPGEYSPQDSINYYRQKIDRLQNMTIPLAAGYPLLDHHKVRGMHVELVLLPDQIVRRALGGTALRPFYGEGGIVLNETLHAHLHIPRSRLVDEEVLEEARHSLVEHLMLDSTGELQLPEVYAGEHHEPLKPSPPTNRMFVKPKFLSEQPLRY